MIHPQALVDKAVRAAREKKAFDVTVLDISRISIIADYFILVSGRSTTQVQAIAQNVKEKLVEAGFYPDKIEGLKEGRWVLLDYGDVILHVFLDTERDFYNLERLWADAEVINC